MNTQSHFDYLHATIMTSPGICNKQDAKAYWVGGTHRLQWIFRYLLGEKVEDELEGFFQELPNWYKTVIEYRDYYQKQFKCVTSEGKNRHLFNGMGKRLMEVAAKIDQIDRLWKAPHPQDRLAGFGIQVTWATVLEVKEAGFAYGRIERIEQQTSIEIPFILLSQILHNLTPEQSKISPWVNQINVWLQTSSDPYSFDLLHRLLQDVVGQEGIDPAGVALAKLYWGLSQYGLVLRGLRSPLHQKWVASLQLGTELPGISLSLEEGPRENKFRTSSKSEEEMYYHPSNPALFLAENLKLCSKQGVWDGLVIGVSYLDPAGRFAIMAPEGKPLLESRDQLQGESWVCAFSLFLAAFAKFGRQPQNFDPQNDIRLLSNGTVLLKIRNSELEDLDLVRIESFVNLLVRRSNSSSEKRLQLTRHIMQASQLASHQQADSLRARFIATRPESIERAVGQAAAELELDYELHQLRAVDLVRQRLESCLKQRAHAITLMPADLADLLITDSAEAFQLSRK